MPALARARIEVCMEEGGHAIGRHDRAASRRRVLEVRTHLRHRVEGDREAVEHGGDEGDGAAEGLGHGGAVPEEDVVAVVPGDEAARGGGGWLGRLGRAPRHGEVGGQEGRTTGGASDCWDLATIMGVGGEGRGEELQSRGGRRKRGAPSDI